MDSRASAKNKELIIVRLLGGLGNQMFQYALGRHLALIHNKPLKLDLSAYRPSGRSSRWVFRSYGLGHFNIQKSVAEDAELKPFKKYLRLTFFSRLLRRVSAYGKYYARGYIFEPPGRNFTFDPWLLDAPLKSVVYLDGFWQSEKYFKAVEGIIRNDFSFKKPPDVANQQMLEEIASVDSVAIHIRHGDNATKIARHHGVLPLKYYKNAVSELAKTISNPNFYIFSDDPAWAKANLKLNHPATFVTHNGEAKHQEDLRLMSHCKHHIIGNSTFSWWGAWLGKQPNQLVYAPKRYHMRVNIPIKDLYPGEWKLMDID